MRARALRAPVFLGSLTRQKGRCAHPPPITASLLLIRPPKIFTIYQTWAAHVKGFFLSTGPQRLWNRKPPCPPAPPIAASLILFILLFLSLLILLVGAILRLLILPFFDPFGVKFINIPVRPYVLNIFVLFFFINIMSPAPPIAASLILTALY